MRVLVVSDVSGYMPGGVPAETVKLLRGLAARGHAMALAGDIPLGGEGVSHYSLTLPARTALAAEVSVAMQAFLPDVVHVIAMSSPGVARLEPVLRGTPWLFTCHSAPPHERKLAYFHAHEALHYLARWLRFLPNTLAWRWLLSRQAMPWVVVHSAAVRDIVVRYGCAADRAVLIPLSHAGDWPSPSPMRAVGDAPVIATVGGVAHTKGQHDMVEALAEVARRHPHVRYRMIGERRDPSYAAYLRARIEALGLGERVEWIEGLRAPEVAAALAEADLYVQPSHEEGFCLAFIEAAGVVPRLVGTDTGTIPAMCDGDSAALCVASRAPERLAADVLQLLALDPAPGTVAARRERLATRFGDASYLDAHEALYACVMSSTRAVVS
jgi:glycosyltransferase involved in cell wall biosynthesis